MFTWAQSVAGFQIGFAHNKTPGKNPDSVFTTRSFIVYESCSIELYFKAVILPQQSLHLVL